jgi:hypothetical protein
MMAAVMRSAANRERTAALGVSRFAAERHQVVLSGHRAVVY